ncbi:MAG: hypothetical protein IT368_13345 [Candidatus Hydrogenedentes bacterium]|nr:hypothetical protein [Candidatus Hydrogenedentota bacterium]
MFRISLGGRLFHVLCMGMLFLGLHATAQDVPLPPRDVPDVKVHRESIRTSGQHQYAISVGGTMDMDNTLTREHGNWRIGFQNNERLVISNTGAIPIVNPRVIINGERQWHDWQSMLEEFTRGAKNDQEKIYLIYDGLRNGRYHDYPLFGDNEYHDPVRFLNIYGGGFCDDSGMVGSALFHLAGFNKDNGGRDPFVRALHGHMMCEVWHDGDYQFMDIDQDAFYLDRENRKPVSGDTIARDHEFALREHAYGPQFQPWDSGPYTAAALFGVDDERSGHGVWGQEMDYVLRPGESIEFRWDNAGFRPWQAYEDEHRYYGNSFLRYAPAMDSLPGQPGVQMEGIVVEGNKLRVTEETAVLSIETSTCYTICGGTIELDSRKGFQGGVPGPSRGGQASRVGDVLPAATVGTGKIALEIKSREDFQTVDEQSLSDATRLNFNLADAGPFHDAPPLKTYAVRFRFEGAQGLVLDRLSLETVLYASPIALPRLRTGDNSVVYTDDTEDPHDVSIEHAWRESSAFTPPAPPMTPITPEDGEAVASTLVPFAWPAVDGCDAYHLMVSRDPEMRYAYRPSYDLILSTHEYEVPYSGMFNPGETYYWRVRPRLLEGLWGDWSPTWSFTWEGPMVPRDVRVEQTGADLWLTWQPNPAGARPVRYDIYGSDSRGFLTSREPRKMPVLGEVEGNFVGTTEDTRLLISGANAFFPGANRAFFRVVAVDAAGTESCPSDYAELPRPHIINPPPPAKAGEPYSHQFTSIHSRGDLQSRYDGLAFWEEESYRYTLVEGPDWLSLSEDGVLTGTAPMAAGEGTFTISIRTEYPKEVGPSSKSGDIFQKSKPERSTTQSFTWQVAGP